MRQPIAALSLIAIAAVGCGGTNEESNRKEQCAEPGDTCNDGLCFNGAANGVCDQNGKCRTTPSTSGDCVVFVTRGTYDGDMGGLEGADAICQRSAEAAALKGTFKAWLSDSTRSAAQRLTQSSVAYIDTRGQVVANDWEDLTDGALQRAITIDETAYDWDGEAQHCAATKWFSRVWTATRTDGSAVAPFCADWTDAGDASATTGMYCYASGEWTHPGPVSVQSGCSASLSLYCLQQ